MQRNTLFSNECWVQIQFRSSYILDCGSNARLHKVPSMCVAVHLQQKKEGESSIDQETMILCFTSFYLLIKKARGWECLRTVIADSVRLQCMSIGNFKVRYFNIVNQHIFIAAVPYFIEYEDFWKHTTYLLPLWHPLSNCSLFLFLFLSVCFCCCLTLKIHKNNLNTKSL